MAEVLKRIPWKPIESLPDDLVKKTNGEFGSLEALRAEWQRYLKTLSEAERTKGRQRTLRKLAVETGIVERLYQIEWGLTLTLVAEGFARDVIERAGGRIEESTLATLKAQRDSLEMVVDFVKENRKLNASFIREL